MKIGNSISYGKYNDDVRYLCDMQTNLQIDYTLRIKLMNDVSFNVLIRHIFLKNKSYPNLTK